MRVVKTVAVAGGYQVHLEIPSGYTNGQPRMRVVFVAAEAMGGGSAEEVIDAVREAVEDPVLRLRGLDCSEPAPETPAVMMRRARARIREWGALDAFVAAAAGEDVEAVEEAMVLRDALYEEARDALQAGSRARAVAKEAGGGGDGTAIGRRG